MSSHSERTFKLAIYLWNDLERVSCFLVLCIHFCCCSVTKSSPILCNPMDCGTPGFLVLHHLPEFCSNSLSQWCHPTISSSAAPFSSCPQSFPASRSFPVSQFFTSDGQSIAVSASVLLMNIQGGFPWELTRLISLLAKGHSRLLQQLKSINSSELSLLYGPAVTSIHDYWKNHSFDSMDLCQQGDVFAF